MLAVFALFAVPALSALPALRDLASDVLHVCAGHLPFRMSLERMVSFLISRLSTKPLAMPEDTPPSREEERNAGDDECGGGPFIAR